MGDFSVGRAENTTFALNGIEPPASNFFRPQHADSRRYCPFGILGYGRENVDRQPASRQCELDWLRLDHAVRAASCAFNHGRLFNFLPLFIPGPKTGDASPFSRGADVDRHPILKKESIMKKHLLTTVALLIAISPVAAEARCVPNNAVIAANAVPVIQYKNTTIDGVKVFYREAGPKDAPVLLLLHGFPTSSH
uniref:alpha/beta fold hydrolase n=1 Tax=Rhizobium ruizarguesonis TaxID=2081791 RepID=UPI0037C6CBC8